MIRVFLVDDHELVRRGIAGLLGLEEDIEIVGEAGTVHQAEVRIAATQPDVVLLDVRLPDGSGIDLCREVRSASPTIRCLILTAYDDDDAIDAAVLAGAAGYVLKDVRGSGLVEALRKVAAGKQLLDPLLMRKVVERIVAPTGNRGLDTLTVREKQILPLIADGLTNREIGVKLSLAEKTVKNYVSGLLSKLGLQRRTQAAILHLESRPAGTRTVEDLV
ncbi:response regulator [Subtercola boreus]|uniref:DNA-binding response regulator n=1 Tax=Subtercola boreus TaxID=120213 RepID=A0A3E0WFL3_9MICO|nr:response regulator transcription factor [Subtercola boreus]RFA23246.1 DNA-binding response regulator [Subtercola boreus]RFA23319.1 DNA-binding response regulator [Subtercola boreus]RFA29122.1 DNA-binding response regulator [Subtercola boreus]